jgi:hypothetical protein
MTRLPLRSSLLSFALNLSVRQGLEANAPGRLRNRWDAKITSKLLERIERNMILSGCHAYECLC